MFLKNLSGVSVFQFTGGYDYIEVMITDQNFSSKTTRLIVDLDLNLMDPLVSRQLIGSLLYLVNTSPNICFAVSTLGQLMGESRHVHWVAAEHVLRY